ncbi:DUF4157 domain-containing protein [Methanosarcina sp. DH2]|uniref:eCIS core domain-containing protein n=1 Tax=Methanosarcina sp. DH2 TaxID=2605639 RepID=UPI001E4D0EFE|nr:DUF4157 domain-containing protein [Methanosarcina sp. DH2]MCC4769558.1 DUF4157 domain-containing protein [Methanosarcina sp. DH2]
MSEKAGVHTKTQEPKHKCSYFCNQKPSHSSSESPADRMLQLQRTAGNQAVQRLIKSRALQAKIRIGQPDDIYEREADRVAKQVMRMPELQVSKGIRISSHIRNKSVQRRCPECTKNNPEKEEEEGTLRKKEVSGPIPKIIPELESRISNMREGGHPLPESVRAFYEPLFGQDFSQVRIHTDSKAVQMNRDLQAQAFAYNQDIYYGDGKSPDKNELTAHELTHVVQQTGGVQTKKVPEQPSVQLKCLACEKKKAEIQRSPEISTSTPGIQRWSLFGDNEDKKESDSSGGSILSWVEEKASEVVNSITEAGGEAVDWAKQQAGAVIQSGDGAGQKGADNNISGTSFSPAALAAAKQLAGKLKCKFSIGQDGITLGCGRIKLTDPQEEKVLEFPKLSKIKNLKDYIIAGVRIDKPELGLDIGPSLWLSVGSITLNDVLIRIDPLHDTYIGQGQVNVPIGSHIVVEVAGKISAGATLSIPVEGFSIPIKGFAEGGFRGDGIGSTIFNFQEMVRLSYIQNKFIFDLESKIKAGFKVQFNVTPFLNVQYKIADREKRLCEFTAPLWTWEKWIKAEELSIPVSINPSKGDKPVTVGPITKQVISGEDIEGNLSRNLPGLQGKCTKFCDLIEGIGGPSQLVVAQSNIGQGQVFSAGQDKVLKALSNAAAEVCGKKEEARGVVNTGLDESHPIGMTWYKPFNEYKPIIKFEHDERYYRTTSKKLPKNIDPDGRSLGVMKWYKEKSKFKKERKTDSRKEQNQLLKILKEYSVDYDERLYQVDHVLDLQLGGDDAFENLWPLDARVNQIANNAHRDQWVWFRISEGSKPIQAVLGDTRLNGRWFIIKNVKG